MRRAAISHRIPCTTHGRQRRILQRLDEAVMRTAVFSRADLIARLRKAMFDDVDELEKSGAVRLPE